MPSWWTAPPSTIPSESEARQQAEAEKKEAEDIKNTKLDIQEFEEDTSVEADLNTIIFTSAAHRGSDTAHLRDQAMADEVEKVMSRVKFCSTSAELLARSREPLQKLSRAFVLMDKLTNTVLHFQEMLALAKDITDAYLAGASSGPEQSKIRLLILVGRRLDLLAKVEDRGTVLWPRWTFMVVQLRKRETQKAHVACSHPAAENGARKPLDAESGPCGICHKSQWGPGVFVGPWHATRLGRSPCLIRGGYEARISTPRLDLLRMNANALNPGIQGSAHWRSCEAGPTSASRSCLLYTSDAADE